MSKRREYTIVLVSEKSGRHYTMKLGLPLLVVLLATLAGLMGASWLSINGLVANKGEQTVSVERIAQLEGQIAGLQQESEEFALYRQWADRIIYQRLNYEDTAGQGSSQLPVASLDGKVISDNPQPNLLDIDDFEVQRVNLALDFEVAFKLINTAADRRKMTGYVFIVASNTDVVPACFASWPQVAIVSGMPGDFRSGLEFSIRSLKKVRGRITQPPTGPKFNRIDLIAYSEDGNIIMKRGYYVERQLQQSPYDSGE